VSLDARLIPPRKRDPVQGRIENLGAYRTNRRTSWVDVLPFWRSRHWSVASHKLRALMKWKGSPQASPVLRAPTTGLEWTSRPLLDPFPTKTMEHGASMYQHAFAPWVCIPVGSCGLMLGTCTSTSMGLIESAPFHRRRPRTQEDV
jgi:hypothetical protein